MFGDSAIDFTLGLTSTMIASQPPSFSPTTGDRAGPGAIALFIVLSLASAYASLMFWILGVGVPRSTHNVMALLFAVINVACSVGGSWCLKRGKRLAAIGVSLAVLPVCIGVVALAAYVVHI